jgi:hypothetical protein
MDSGMAGTWHTRVHRRCSYRLETKEERLIQAGGDIDYPLWGSTHISLGRLNEHFNLNVRTTGQKHLKPYTTRKIADSLPATDFCGISINDIQIKLHAWKWRLVLVP